MFISQSQGKSRAMLLLSGRLIVLMIGLSGFVFLSLSGGCSSSDTSFTRFNPDNRFVLKHNEAERMVIGITDPGQGVFDTADWAFIKHRAPWQPLSVAIGDALRVPVAFRQLKAFQVAHQLERGRCDFALVSNEEFQQLSAAGTMMKEVVLAEPYQRQGVLVTRAGSDVKSLTDFRGLAFAFGPRTDPVLFYQALKQYW
ncbi:MAG: PhnD/SsuA/transferrin family substrate-binding protein [Phycisphaerae bacterium]